MTTPWFTASPASLVLFVGVFVAAFSALLAVFLGPGRLQKGRVARAAAELAGFSIFVVLLASTGLLLSFSLPPRPLLAAWVGFFWLSWVSRKSAFGATLTSLPIGYLVLLQAFRLPLELVMHRLASERVMPREMSFQGLNFDILTGMLAVVVGIGLLRFRWPTWTAWVFQIVGLGLLLNVIGVAVRTMPGAPARIVTEVPNVWVAFPPFVLLPAMLVPLAGWLHYRLFLRLMRPASARDASSEVRGAHVEKTAGSDKTIEKPVREEGPQGQQDDAGGRGR
jgi:hypothetical protein